MIVVKKRRKVIRVYERTVATKHPFGKMTLFLLVCLILFLTTILMQQLLTLSSYFYIRMTIGMGVLFFGLILLIILFAFYYRSKKTPYQKIIYDSKYKWFKVYRRNYYHIVRPTDIIGLKDVTFYKYQEDTSEKGFGYIKISTLEYSLETAEKEKKSMIILCSEPKEVKTLIRKYMNDKLQDDYNKIEKQRLLAKKERSRIRYKETYEMNRQDIQDAIKDIQQDLNK